MSNVKPADKATRQGGSFRIGDLETELPTYELDSDRESDGVLRELAHAPPRAPRGTVGPGARWGAADRYLIERRLGRGGMGTVYAATDTVLGRVVALKVLDAAGADHDPAHHAQLLREAQLAARVEHERIARVYDVGCHDGYAFVAMEHVAGGTLRQWMRQHDVELPQVLDIATQIAEGLAELHAEGVIHRDLKPENVMLSAQGGIKLLDFGLARNTIVAAGEPGAPAGAASRDGQTFTAVSGTPGYMAPEQYGGGPIDARVDVFALGVIIYELVTGERLFRGTTAGTAMTATFEGAPVLRDGAWAHVPERLRDHTARMLALDPDARFEDGSSVLAALRDVAGTPAPVRLPLPAATAHAFASGPTQRSLSQRSAEPVHTGVAANRVLRGAAVAAVVAVLVFMRPSPAPPQPVPPAPPGMVRIDVGAIEVGRDADEIDRECQAIGAGCDRAQMLREVPRAKLTVPAFFLDRYEVTNQEFADLLEAFTGTLVVFDDEDHHYPRFVRRNAGTGGEDALIDLNDKHGGIEYIDRKHFRPRAGRERLPAAQVTWYGAKLYCETHGKRLPTEDEWEAAARGRDDRRFPWGDAVPRCGDVVIANDGKLPIVGACPEGDVAERAVGAAYQDVTPDGIHDLGGNVSEWTSSVFVEGNRVTAPGGPRDAMRVIRGGSWGASLRARTSGRGRSAPSIMGANLGFRCASSAEDARP